MRAIAPLLFALLLTGCRAQPVTVIIVTATPEPTPVVTSEPARRLYGLESGVRALAAPRADAPVVCAFKSIFADEVTREGDWLKLRSTRCEGWVHQDDAVPLFRE